MKSISCVVAAVGVSAGASFGGVMHPLTDSAAGTRPERGAAVISSIAMGTEGSPFSLNFGAGIESPAFDNAPIMLDRSASDFDLRTPVGHDETRGGIAPVGEGEGPVTSLSVPAPGAFLLGSIGMSVIAGSRRRHR
jgi:hypothetical protein